jgi:hypothetical protein
VQGIRLYGKLDGMYVNRREFIFGFCVGIDGAGVYGVCVCVTPARWPWREISEKIKSKHGTNGRPQLPQPTAPARTMNHHHNH